jgi:hypothetical protein
VLHQDVGESQDLTECYQCVLRFMQDLPNGIASEQLKQEKGGGKVAAAHL